MFNIILRLFQVQGMEVGQWYTLQSASPISSTSLAPYLVSTILVTILPLLYFISPRLFCSCQRGKGLGDWAKKIFFLPWGKHLAVLHSILRGFSLAVGVEDKA